MESLTLAGNLSSVPQALILDSWAEVGEGRDSTQALGPRGAAPKFSPGPLHLTSFSP